MASLNVSDKFVSESDAPVNNGPGQITSNAAIAAAKTAQRLLADTLKSSERNLEQNPIGLNRKRISRDSQNVTDRRVSSD
jgi:hypothetical protein